MQNVLCRYCFLADTALGKGNILRNMTIEVMGNHNHVEGFFGRIHCVRPRRSRRSREDICLTADFDNIRGMPATGTFGVKGVNGSALEGCDCSLDKTALVQGVGMDGNLYVHVIRDCEAAIDGSGRRPPIFMKLQATGPGLDLLYETRCRAGVTFAENAEIHGKGVGRLEHALNMPGSWRTGRGRGSRCRPCPTADHGGEA